MLIARANKGDIITARLPCKIRLTLYCMQDNASLSQQEEIDRSIAEAYEAADFLTEFVVQAKLNERGNFGTFKIKLTC